MSLVCDIIVCVLLFKLKKRLKIFECVLMYDDFKIELLFFYKWIKLFLEGKDVEDLNVSDGNRSLLRFFLFVCFWDKKFKECLKEKCNGVLVFCVGLDGLEIYEDVILLMFLRFIMCGEKIK